MRPIVVSIVFLLSFSANAALAADRQFGGNECIDDCSGHKAGYEWAEAKGITDPSICQSVLIRCPNCTSFAEGCETYTDDPGRGADEDDDGESID
jgi:hypothetical protein